MSEEKKDDLFELIHCMDAAEKGFFSKFAQRHVLKEGNNYEQLFQILAKMPAYDADVVSAELKKLGIGTPLPAAKNYLKLIILRAMRDYNSSRDTHTTLLEGLQNLAFLYDKKQYDLLRKELKRLKKIAEMYAEHHILFKIGDYEKKLHKETARRDIIEGMEEILSEMQAQAAAFQNQLRFEHFLEKISVITQKRGSDREQAVNALLASELLTAEENATTLFSRIYYHQIHAIAYMLKGENEASQKKYGAVLSIWEAAPHLIQEFPARYRRILNNYLVICSLTGDYQVFEQLLAKVRSSPATQPVDRAEIFSIAHNAELLSRMGTYDWAGVEAMIPSLKAGLDAYGPLLRQSTVLVFQYHIAIFYFLSGDYASCRKWLREITETPRTEQRMDIQRMAKVLNLLLLWQKRDHELLEFELRAVTRYFENWGGGVLEQNAVQLVQALLNAEDEASAKSALKEFEECISQSGMEEALGGSVLRAWAIAQQRGASAREVIAGI
jgi:hypothetical protein